MQNIVDKVDMVIEAMGFEAAMTTDPVRVAVGAAVYAASPITIGQAAIERLPSNATDFERGLTLGVAMMLAASR